MTDCGFLKGLINDSGGRDGSGIEGEGGAGCRREHGTGEGGGPGALPGGGEGRDRRPRRPPAERGGGMDPAGNGGRGAGPPRGRERCGAGEGLCPQRDRPLRDGGHPREQRGRSPGGRFPRYRRNALGERLPAQPPLDDPDDARGGSGPEGEALGADHQHDLDLRQAADRRPDPLQHRPRRRDRTRQEPLQ
jgi:hypothetical protein